ncbi:undecaprenyl-phosphate glucose phosphotransferase [Kushneria pakistanensis]|uniref:Undecaprenyl-phosphate glucose phosphotransferase n=1 Tax=Kushneria pakistanensis TaxID=1508770 RepID=A0ABQ3FM34_9GAMM|nr:undecaprenyl-phosphate glucose phosphotransferase [Kushneria pakistanensis]GHC29869.1 undecaprenyl-phosphate glucose phosphotransferase [Kushneria pakistanensis]
MVFKRKGSLLIERAPLHIFAMLCDAIAIAVSGVIIYYVRFGEIDIEERYWWALSVITLLLLFLNQSAEAYRRWRTRRFSEILFRLFWVWIGVTIAATSIIYFLHVAERYSRLWLVLTMALSFAIAVLVRWGARSVLLRYRLRGRHRRPVFLVGPGKTLLNITQHMRARQGAGYSVSGVHRLNRELSEFDLANIARRVARSECREVWICMPLSMGNTVQAIMYALRHQTAEIRFFPELSDLPLLNHRVSEIVGLYSIDLSVSPMAGGARFAKRLEDIILGSIITLLVLPVCIVIAIAIKCSSPGPVLFKQYRTGINGKHFKVYKFRSMKIHQEKGGQVTQAKRGDSRITSVGAFLRRTSLDELPQFYNVLQGRMSIVGPRPHALAHNEHYKELVQSYMQRHKVKPGVTGWAQVSGLRGETDTLEKMQKRVQFDLWYIDNWSLALDLKIIFLTVFKGFFGKNVY